nr:hypothetical protein BaRGS_032306 [Batillaria attramentaria]
MVTPLTCHSRFVICGQDVSPRSAKPRMSQCALAHNSSKNATSTTSISSGSNDNTIPSSHKTNTAIVPDQRLVVAMRSMIVMTVLACYVMCDVIQGWVDVTWDYLRSCAFFTSVYFETWWATLCYAIVIPYPFALHYMSFMDRYKVDPTVTYVHTVIGSIILYDALFFLIHLTLHKSRFLYTLLHAYHHEHDVMHAHVTNQLTVGERIVLVLAANQALKILYSHPMSRAAFVPVFIFLLTDNHSGYDLPWGLQHIIPGHVMGGPRVHHAHHMLGTRHYQPFFTYFDSLLEWWEGRGRHRVKAC